MPHGSHKFEAEGDFVERLEGKKRQERLPLARILPRLKLTKNDLVVDLGPGTGYFAFPIAKSAKQVLGVDIEDKMLKLIRQRTAERKVENLSVLRGDMVRMPIADSTADHILAAFVYHEVGSQAELMAECARVLKRGGMLTVIDFQKIAEDEGPPLSVRKSPDHVKKASSKWFKLVSRDGTKGYYQLMFSKR